MLSSTLDMDEISKLIIMHEHAVSRALARVLGQGRVAIINDYAKALYTLGREFGFNLDNIDAFISSLKDTGLAKGCMLNRLSENEVEFEIKGCAIAPLVHKHLGMIGVTGDLCAEVAMAMVVLAVERGWKPTENIFDYIQFSGSLSEFSNDGAKAVFKTTKTTT